MTRLFTMLCAAFVAACSSGSDSGGGSTAGTGGATLGAAGSGGDAAARSPGSGGATAAPEAGADTWSNFAEAFFATYCVSCHDGRPTIKGDFRNLSDVVQHHADIRCGIATTVLSGCAQSSYPPRQFPIGNGPKPSDAERDRLVAWIDGGLKM